MPKLESKVKKRCIGLALFPSGFAIVCGESAAGFVKKSLKKRPGYNVIVDGWIGIFNPMPHPFTHAHN